MDCLLGYPPFLAVITLFPGIRVELVPVAPFPCRALVFGWAVYDPDHDAVIRIGG